MAALAWIPGCRRSGSEGFVRPLDKAPELELPDTSGKTVRLSDYRGKVVLLDFWATYCDACHEAVPAFQHFSDEFGGDGLAVLGLSIDTYTGHVADFAKEVGMGYTVLLDPDLAAARSYGVADLPTTFLIGRDGIVRRRWVGFEDDLVDEMKEEIEAALQKTS